MGTSLVMLTMYKQRFALDFCGPFENSTGTGTTVELCSWVLFPVVCMGAEMPSEGKLLVLHAYHAPSAKEGCRTNTM